MNNINGNGNTCNNKNVKEEVMRRDFRKKQDNKVLMYSIGAGLALIAIVFALLMYSSSINNDVRNSQLDSDQIASILKDDENEKSESASNNMGKTVEEGKDELEKDNDKETSLTNASKVEENMKDENKTENSKETNAKTSEYKTEDENNQVKSSNSSETTETSAKVSKEEKKDLVFQKPVEGEIVKEFAKENLIYSDTLKEWVTHLGIDIKAEKTSVVNAAEAGTIKSIKNDPRYGLTIVIDHENGYQTVYANLLSSEFVNVGDTVEKGQAIGTVGNTGVFESADEPHLHFELLKDSMQLDPNIYLR